MPILSRFFSKNKSRRTGNLSYDEAKALASDADEKVRSDLAKRTDLPPEILYFLAEDLSVDVRLQIASNEAAPRHADLLLTQDKDERVRSTLAEKIVRLAPSLSNDEHDRLRRLTYDALSLLARDQALRVRQILSDALKEVTDAPPDVIRRLAWDVEAAVATPVLRFSPVLTDEDLIDIIRGRPSAASISAISERDGVSVVVSDAIVESDDVDAIGLLLGNHSAQIREETLDKVIERAVDIDLWHGPLAMRPRLPAATAVKIARFVAEDILKRMAAREDLSSDVIRLVRTVVHKRLGDPEAIAPAAGVPQPKASNGVRVDDHDAFDSTTDQWAKGELDEKSLLKAITDGERAKAMSIIAAMADLPISVVEKTCKNRSAKGCVALTWRAGLSPAMAEIIQQKLGYVSPRDMIACSNGEFPLSEDDLAWQIDFIRDL